MEAVRYATVDLETSPANCKADQFRKFVTRYHGIPAEGDAFRTISEIVRALTVKACVMVDSDPRSIIPERSDILLKPVLEGRYDDVSPSYMRHKDDGTITNSIVYPLIRARYGNQIRQLIDENSGLRRTDGVLSARGLPGKVASFGIETWNSTAEKVEERLFVLTPVSDLDDKEIAGKCPGRRFKLRNTERSQNDEIKHISRFYR